MKLSDGDWDYLLWCVGDFVPAWDECPKNLDEIHDSIPEPKPAKEKLKYIISKMVDEDHIEIFGWGNTGLGNPPIKWLHYRWAKI